MTLQELKEQIDKLSTSDRLTLISLIIESLQREKSDNLEQKQFDPSDISPQQHLHTDRANVINTMRGFLKTDQPAPTDSEVQAMLEQRLVEKYLQ
ncbi:hypothetical protein [Nostoc sp. UHCC 0870]|uniref:hypothetical protein n=1 Tax=Nostoc sp. UHCC 0870 TaxID=2914041 RepID=UPI001EDD9F12|nr:hypothetical protein [Nostoc sp. UHCC 0870]UKO96666.1 hypothetical protein L6494_18885 [Nostoc sp. UHCC 0870]